MAWTKGGRKLKNIGEKNNGEEEKKRVPFRGSFKRVNSMRMVQRGEQQETSFFFAGGGKKESTFGRMGMVGKGIKTEVEEEEKEHGEKQGTFKKDCLLMKSN